jgi:hypothetical protein
MDELKSGGRLSADDFVLIADLIATCLSAGIALPVSAMSGAERTRLCRERKKEAPSNDVTLHVTEHIDILNNSQSKRGGGETAREAGCNPRANGTNPRALGTNPRAIRKPTGEPLFDEFWRIFPRKIAKSPALKAWQAKIRQGVDPQTMIDGASRYAKEMVGKEPIYIKYPQGWIAGERWLDEPEKPKGAVLAGPWKPVRPEPERPKITEEERQRNLAKLTNLVSSTLKWK